MLASASSLCATIARDPVTRHHSKECVRLPDEVSCLIGIGPRLRAATGIAGRRLEGPTVPLLEHRRHAAGPSVARAGPPGPPEHSAEQAEQEKEEQQREDDPEEPERSVVPERPVRP